MNLKSITIILISMSFSHLVIAETDVVKKIDEIKTSYENSSKNYDTFKTNYDVSNQNVKEIGVAAKQLKTLKKQFVENDDRIENNKRILTKQIKSYSAFIEDEQTQIKNEKEQLKALALLKEKITQNIEARKTNITSYEGEIEKLNSEVLNWDDKNRDLASLRTLITEKERLASDDLKTWTEKKEKYKKEAMKWKEQAKSLKKTYIKLNGLNK